MITVDGSENPAKHLLSTLKKTMAYGNMGYSLYQLVQDYPFYQQ